MLRLTHSLLTYNAYLQFYAFLHFHRISPDHRNRKFCDCNDDEFVSILVIYDLKSNDNVEHITRHSIDLSKDKMCYGNQEEEQKQSSYCLQCSRGHSSITLHLCFRSAEPLVLSHCFVKFPLINFTN